MKKCPLFIITLLLLFVCAVLVLLLPVREKSLLEKRMLQVETGVDMQQLLSGTAPDTQQLEKYLCDQFPFRDAAAVIYATMENAMGKVVRDGVVICSDGRMVDPACGMDPEIAARNAAAMETLTQKTGLPVDAAIIPTAAYIYRESLPVGIERPDEAGILNTLCGLASVRAVDLFPRMEEHKNDTLLFYRTDHHYTDEGAYLVYRALCEAWGITPADGMEKTVAEGFSGSLFAQYPTLLSGQDVFCVPVCDSRVLIDDQQKPSMLDPNAMKERDKYAALMWGNAMKAELINEQAPGGTLLLLRDSFANALMPYLSQHYKHVIAIDPRYYKKDIVQFAAECGAQRILCLFGANTFATDTSLRRMRGLR